MVWGHDIFGPNSGRTYELVDQLAADTEYTVLLPDFFRGAISPPADTYEWETVLRVIMFQFTAHAVLAPEFLRLFFSMTGKTH